MLTPELRMNPLSPPSLREGALLPLPYWLHVGHISHSVSRVSPIRPITPGMPGPFGSPRFPGSPVIPFFGLLLT